MQMDDSKKAGGDATSGDEKPNHEPSGVKFPAANSRVAGRTGSGGNPVKSPDTAVYMNSDDERRGRKSKNSDDCCKSTCLLLFGTRTFVSKYDREDYIRTTLVELLVYILYLVVTCTITYGLSISSTFYFTNAISHLFLDTPFGPGRPTTTFRTSTTVNDFWTFTENVMPDGLYWSYWYGINDPAYQIPLKDQGILYENRLIGLPRLRQIRVTEVKCPISQKFTRLFRTCYPSYSRSYEDKNRWHPTLQDSAWKYHSEEKLGGTSHWGRLGTYSGGGAYKLLNTDRAGTIQTVGQLKNLKWITRATRVIFLDFTVYNANVNLFCIVKLVWEFPSTGGVITSWSIRTIRLDRYATAYDYFILVLEIIFIIFTIYYTIQEFMEMCMSKCSDYWSEFWTYLDLSILIISYACIGFGFYRYFLTLYTLQGLIQDPNKYANFYWLGFWETQFDNTVAVLVFLAWIKIFKYISFNKTMNQLSSTMSRCAKDVGGFAIMFFIVFFAFAQLGYLLFGSTVDDFRTFHDTIYALLRLILGDFNFRAIEAANRILGPVFFITYVFFVFFVLLNMFLAIINDTYSEVKAEGKVHGDEFQMSDYLRRSFNNCCAIVGCKSKQVEAEGKAKLATSANVITNDEIRENLAKSKFTDVEVEMFLTRYELDESRPMDVDEAENVLGGLEGHHGEEVPVADGVTPRSGTTKNPTLTDVEISELQSRVGLLETTLTKITRTMDNLLSKLETIDSKRENKGPMPQQMYNF